MQKRLMTYLLTMLALFSAGPAVAQDTASVAVTSARLSLTGTSTMHDYALATTAVTITGDVAGPMLQVGALRNVVLTIPVNSFTADKDGLKKKMLETIKADKNPLITFTLGGYMVDGPAVRATGTLTVAGVTKEISLSLEVKETATGVQVTGTRELLMSEFGMKPPTMFMGMLKTADQVTITFELQLTPAGKASN